MERAAEFDVSVSRLFGFSAFQNWQSNSNFVVSLPNLSKKDVKGLLFRQQALITTPNRESNSNFVVSLPNVSEKDVKGLLSRQ